MNSEIYGERIKALAATPSQRLEHPGASQSLDNPLCGDRVTVEVLVKDGKTVAVGHAVTGCLLCKAAATLVAQRAVGLDGEAAAGLLEQAQSVLKGGAEPGLAELAVFAPVAPHKSRHDCVLLPFKALVKVLRSA